MQCQYETGRVKRQRPSHLCCARLLSSLQSFRILTDLYLPTSTLMMMRL